MTLHQSKAVIGVDGELLHMSNINVVVRQGDTLSTMLFNLLLEAAIRKANITGEINTDNKSSQIIKEMTQPLPAKAKHTYRKLGQISTGRHK